ncbi:hypothetical protein B0H16DRAFT_1475385 [Mycena metata]|uniref:Uncharacterized protein n=1 Tax=Mycena metata TaxID=1033252 RepID=A0AAD7HEP7_9AGAR|nr:hypothetical protein B0H16DRAFT_1475385 [Mycena metata]
MSIPGIFSSAVAVERVFWWTRYHLFAAGTPQPRDNSDFDAGETPAAPQAQSSRGCPSRYGSSLDKVVELSGASTQWLEQAQYEYNCSGLPKRGNNGEAGHHEYVIIAGHYAPAIWTMLHKGFIPLYKPPGMQTMYLQAKGNKKGSKKGRKKGAPSGGFTVALFLALFVLIPLLYLGKKTGWKTEKMGKREKKGSEKGGKRATVNDPIEGLYDPNWSLEGLPRFKQRWGTSVRTWLAKISCWEVHWKLMNIPDHRVSRLKGFPENPVFDLFSGVKKCVVHYIEVLPDIMPWTKPEECVLDGHVGILSRRWRSVHSGSQSTMEVQGESIIKSWPLYFTAGQLLSVASFPARYSNAI